MKEVSLICAGENCQFKVYQASSGMAIEATTATPISTQIPYIVNIAQAPGATASNDILLQLTFTNKTQRKTPVDIAIPFKRPYKRTSETRVDDWLIKRVFSIAKKVTLNPTHELCKNKIIQALALQVQDFVTVERLNEQNEKDKYQITLAEYGCLVDLVPLENSTSQSTTRKDSPISVNSDSDSGNSSNDNEQPVTIAIPVNKLVSANIQLLTTQLANVVRIVINDQPPIIFEIGTEPTDNPNLTQQLLTLYQLASVASGTKAYHAMHSVYHQGRIVLTELAKPYLQGDLLGSRFFSSNTWSVIVLVLAILSSFTMADEVPNNRFKSSMLFISMIGAAVLNYIGGANFSGFPENKTEIAFFIWGIASAISPAVMTVFGVEAFGITWIAGLIFGICNFILSALLGYDALHGIAGTLKDFFQGDYYGGFFGDYTGCRKTVAFIELLLYFFVAWTISMTRMYAGVKFFLCGPVDKTCTVASATKRQGSAAYYGANIGSAVCNLPELVLFVTFILQLRMRLSQSLLQAGYPQGYAASFSFALAIILSISFFTVFKDIAQDAWDSEFTKWFKHNKIFEQIFVNSAAAGAGALVIGSGRTIQAMMGSAKKLGQCIGKVICSSCGSTNRCCCRPKKPAINPEETTPLLTSDPAATTSKITLHQTTLTYLGSAATKKQLQQLAEQSTQAPWSIWGFETFNNWLVRCGSYDPRSWFLRQFYSSQQSEV